MTHIDDLHQLLHQTEVLHKKSPNEALAFARGWFYIPQIDLRLDPLSEEYFQVQKRHYELFSGKSWGTFDLVAQSERIDFHNLGDLYPYAVRDSRLVGAHLQKIGYWISQMDLKTSDRIIEFGAGSAELAGFLSQSGYDILATDISETYVDVIRRKAEFLKLPLKSLRIDMAKISPSATYDVVIFCESFHHSSQFLDSPFQPIDPSTMRHRWSASQRRDPLNPPTRLLSPNLFTTTLHLCHPSCESL